MVVWSYPLAFAGQDIRAACAKGGLVARILEAASATAEARPGKKTP
jgi:hypothetical protein